MGSSAISVLARGEHARIVKMEERNSKGVEENKRIRAIRMSGREGKLGANGQIAPPTTDVRVPMV